VKVLVLGGGVIGVTSAYYLAKAGHEVTVVERQPKPALETSFANAGEVSPGYASPWAGPGVPVKAIKWLLMKHGPLVIRPKPDPAMWIWLFKMLRNCTSARYAINKSRMIPIAEYSRDCLRALRIETGIRYDERSRGTLQLFRKSAQLDGTADDIAVLRQYGVPYELLDRAGCIAALAARAAELGVKFVFNTAIESLISDGARIGGVATSAGLLRADAYVVALGSWSPYLLRPIGLSVPVYAVKGYSITVPVVDPDAAPVSTVMDESYKVAITRLGDRIRVGGTAEISGYSNRLHAARRATLDHSVSDLFPRGGNLAEASFWCGLRPMTPDGPPVIGPTRYANLHLNTGHGTLGWTMACGSGRVLADLLSGKTPDIDTRELALSRYEHRFG
jgi:D-amino-acid dehydrogenase